MGNPKRIDCSAPETFEQWKACSQAQEVENILSDRPAPDVAAGLKARCAQASMPKAAWEHEARKQAPGAK